MTAYGAARAEAEARAGIDPLDDLLYERSQIVAKLAPLRAIYGSWGTIDHSRKVELARCRQIVQSKAARDGVKMTVDDLDMAARLHPDYMGFIAQMTSGRTEWITLEEQVTEIDYRINRGQALLRYIASEPK
jgi:hypothetical protein